MDNNTEGSLDKLTLTECVNGVFKCDILITGKNFGIKGWLHSGKVKIPCLVCHENLDSFSCFYNSQKKGKSYHWALFCEACKTTVIPSKLEIDQRKMLYSSRQPTDSNPKTTQQPEDLTEQKDREVLDNIYVIMRKMRASRKELVNEDSVTLVSKVANTMLSTLS